MAWVGAEERKQILNETLAEGFHYLGPRIECHGQEDVTRNLEAFQQRQTGGSFVLLDILGHHNVAMISWQLIKKTARPPIEATMSHSSIKRASSRTSEVSSLSDPTETAVEKNQAPWPNHPRQRGK